MQENYNWGILGPGKIAHKFAACLQSVPGAKLYAVGSRDQERARTFASQYNVDKSYGSYEQLVSDPGLHIVYIATPHVFHMENTLLCLQHGKAVLCEKPLAINSYQVKRMITASVENNTFLMEALWSRFLPSIIQLKQKANDGSIGRANHLKADFGFKATYDPDSRLFAPGLGGGALLDIGIYPLFLAVYLFGTPVEIESKAEFAETGVDESCQVRLGFEGGRSADLSFTLAENTPVEARVTGDQGELVLPNRWYQPVNLFTTKEQKSNEQVIDFLGNGYNYQAVEVQKCLDQGKIQSSRWSHQASLQLMQLMDTIRQQCGIEYQADQLG